MSINSLSSSSAVLTIYLRTHINTVNSLLLHFATLLNMYLTKLLPHINPNLTILSKTCIIYNFSIMLEIFAYYAGIMLNAFTILLCSKLFCIIGSSLVYGGVIDTREIITIEYYLLL